MFIWINSILISFFSHNITSFHLIILRFKK
uniref:Uncharacterized protein n=1 Tax=Siphoviridae sp. ctTC45 TaxID=2827573 RepID=A0A8S5LQ81_9CAUD|nr:MAG TPA: hypothetical protein [Siphoviridae sp. ctTC45]